MDRDDQAADGSGGAFVLDVVPNVAERRLTVSLSRPGMGILSHDSSFDSKRTYWEALFDLRGYVLERGGEIGSAGAFLGADVLGPDILRALARDTRQRSLEVRLPHPREGLLAAAMTRVPWEIARAAPDDESLADRNVVVRSVHIASAPSTRRTAPPPSSKGLIKVLLVFTESPTSRPLAARREREELLALFYDEVMRGDRLVEVDVLHHGVTLPLVAEQVQSKGGYHIVHVSGHGHHDALEFPREDGTTEVVSGAAFARLFQKAGGFHPQLVFLNACHSGAAFARADWSVLQRWLHNRKATLDPAPGTPFAGTSVGFTGAALELLGEGVAQVVAMRYEVGDDYARTLACETYRALLAHGANHPVEVALALGRRSAAEATGPSVDSAAPALFGAAPLQLIPVRGRSASLDRRRPRPDPLLDDGSDDLDPPPPHQSIARTDELRRIAGWLRKEGGHLLEIHGAQGLGKTSLAAEVIHLWHDRFDLVLPFLLRGRGLTIDDFYQRLHRRLKKHSPLYQRTLDGNARLAVYLPHDPDDAEHRLSEMRSNLVSVLKQQSLLVVLDGFEANLAGLPVAGERRPSRDREWDLVFEAFAQQLHRAKSCCLVTSAHPLAVSAAPRNAARALSIGLDTLQGPAREELAGPASAARLPPRVAEAADGVPLVAQLFRSGSGELTPLLAAAGVVVAPGEAPELDSAAAIDALIARLTPGEQWALWLVTRCAEPVDEDMLLRIAARLDLPEEATAHLDTDAWRGEKDGRGDTVKAALRSLHGKMFLRMNDRGQYLFHDMIADRVSMYSAEQRQGRSSWDEGRAWESVGALCLERAAVAESGERGSWRRRGLRYLLRAGALARVVEEVRRAAEGGADAEAMKEDLRAAADSLLPEERGRANELLEEAERASVPAGDPGASHDVTGRSGTRFAGYRIVALLGAGGMADVYRALDPAGRVVALKILHPQAAGLQAAELTVNLVQHEDVVPILASGTAENRKYVVMPLVEGRTLERLWLDRGRSLPVAVVLAAAARVLAVLEKVHGQGIAHRDIKPSNLFVTTEGRVKLLDFGIARSVGAGPREAATLLRTGVRIGTEGFWSPEQALGARADARMDIFALGATMFAMLAGRALSIEDDVRQPGARAALRSKGVPDSVIQVIERAIKFEREERYRTAREMLDAVRDVFLREVGEELDDTAPITAKLPVEGVRPKAGEGAGVAAPKGAGAGENKGAGRGEGKSAGPGEGKSAGPGEGKSAGLPATATATATATESGIPETIANTVAGGPPILPDERKSSTGGRWRGQPVWALGAAGAIGVLLCVGGYFALRNWTSPGSAQDAGVTDAPPAVDVSADPEPTATATTTSSGQPNPCANKDPQTPCLHAGKYDWVCDDHQKCVECYRDKTCGDKHCEAGKCVDTLKQCGDNSLNVDLYETDLNCGDRCSPCANGRACNVGGDCLSGICDGPPAKPAGPLAKGAVPGAHTCRAKAMGAKCTRDAECETACVDGVCCESQCNGLCEACGEHGDCRPIPHGQDPRKECSPNEACDGARTCRKDLGQSCATSQACLSAFCAQGVCCKGACTDDCKSCALPGSEGMCAARPADELSSSRQCTCDGKGECKKADGVACTEDGQCLHGKCRKTATAKLCCSESCEGQYCSASGTGCEPIPPDPDAGSTGTTTTPAPPADAGTD